MTDAVPRVTFHPSGRTLDVPPGTTLLEATRAAGLPLAASCDGATVCGWCRIHVLTGGEALSPPAPAESARLARRGAAPDERLACVARILGDVTVTASYW